MRSTQANPEPGAGVPDGGIVTGDGCLYAVERRFGLVRCRPGVRHTSTSRYGPWMERVPGLAQIGAIGVLLDHSMGETFYLDRPADHWSLTTELAYDVLVAPPWDTAFLHVEVEVVRREAGGGFARCELRDDRGRLLVVATTWVRYVPATPDAQPQEPDWPAAAPVAGSLVELLGCRIDDAQDGVDVALPETSGWSNSYGLLHGGVWAVLAELAAAETFARGRSELATTHVHLSYLRSAEAGAVSVQARRRHQGRSFGEAEVVGIDASGRRCVTATVTGRSLC